ncbi:dCMP deaminase [Patescibacteria group bacterium]|nr:dCMP deaminase [Patescibacteria group bacterium]
MKNKTKVFMKVAELFAEQSTCISKQIGAVIVKDERIISTGYNGVPSGQLHCYGLFKEELFLLKSKPYSKEMEEFKKRHYVFQKENELHAEMNAIAFAAKNGEILNGTEIYVTFSPCFDCAKMIVACGIKKVYFKYLYEKEDSRSFLKENEVEVIQVK